MVSMSTDASRYSRAASSRDAAATRSAMIGSSAVTSVPSTTTGTPADQETVQRRQRAQPQRGDRIEDAGMLDAVDAPHRDVGELARLERADLGVATEHAGPAHRRDAQPVADAERVGAGAQAVHEHRLADLDAELARLVRRGAVDAEAHRDPGTSMSRTGAMPAARRALEDGQCATPVPVAA